MLKARLALDDCRFALTKLAQAEGRQEYRVMFLATVALCRAVGDVFNKVDKVQCPSVEGLINHQWRRIEADKNEGKSIFWDFIRKERDTIIHTYQLGYDDDSMDLRTVDDVYSIEDMYTCAMKQGPFKGVDSIELLMQANEWWDAQLSEIERSLAEADKKGAASIETKSSQG